MTEFWTADLHFFHTNVIEYCRRPFKDIDDMHEAIVNGWNQRVSDRDLVWVIGDVAFASPKKVRPFIDRMDGYKILVRGNHDPKPKDCLKMGFNAVIDGPLEVQIGGLRCLVSHYPYHDPRDERYVERRPKDNGLWLIHGHVHSEWKVKDRQINVGCDAWDFKPIDTETIKSVISTPK